MVYVEFWGMVFNVYLVKKECGWWLLKLDVFNIVFDNLLWVKKYVLEWSYSLFYVDVGIVVDYKKWV